MILRPLELIRQDAKNKKVAIETAIEKVPCTVHIDPDRLTQCLLNLFLNAVQAMADGGTLTVACRSNGSRFVDITVSDTGTGIAKDQLGQVFDPYFTTKSDGTGLGLAIVHKIIEAHDGTVHADSSPGSGTTFTLRIPCNAGDEERRPS